MPKILYTDKNFGDKSLDIIYEANGIIEEYEADGFKLTLRQLYYQFVARGLMENDTGLYNRMGSIISDARLAGLIDWEAIEDRTRNLQANSHWNDPGEILTAAARGFMLDHWVGQHYRVEVWIEKEALVGVIASICEELDVSYFACKGYVSQSEMWNAAQRLKSYKDNGHRPVIIHLGDHDPSGIDMTRDIFDRQKLFDGAVDVERIALNMNQVRKYNPPPNPAKLTDSRCKGYMSEYGDKSWELDALEPRMLQRLIKSTVEEYREKEPYMEVKRQEQEYKNILDNIEKNWKTL